jgi:hypothetical protein
MVLTAHPRLHGTKPFEKRADQFLCPRDFGTAERREKVLNVHRRATAATATQFLDSLQQKMPFPIRAVQRWRIRSRVRTGM